MRELESGSIAEGGIVFTRLVDGDGQFSVNVMTNGIRVHRVIGRISEGANLGQAQAFIERVRHEARTDRLSLPKGRKVALTFRSSADHYLDRLAAEGGRDLKMKKRRLELHLVPFFGDIALSKIGTFDVERYKTWRLSQRVIVSPRGKTIAASRRAAQTVSKATINRELAVLSHLVNRAIDWGWLESRPVRIRRYPERGARITYLTVEQIDRVLCAARSDPHPYIYSFIFIGLETGMRRTEILSIRTKDIDVARRVIFIPKAKAGAREQPITARLADFLKDQLAQSQTDSPYLFPAVNSKSGHATDIRKRFRSVVERVGLDPDKITPHTLRHTAISHLVQAGVDLPTVMRISGHRTLTMVQRYAHANGAHIAEAMDRLLARYQSAVPPLRFQKTAVTN